LLVPRLIPCLLLRDGGLVKTIKFSNPKYVGDPLNAVKIFNEKVVDELIVIDIDASVQQNEPDYNLISQIASECEMPLCYGGGVSTVEQIEHIISLGVEKVALSSAALSRPRLIHEASLRVGSQSIVLVLDIKRNRLRKSKFSVHINNGSKRISVDPLEFSLLAQNQGIGEIIINSIDRDGTLSGYDLDLIDHFYDKISVPLTVMGGASSYEDFKQLFSKYSIIGCAAGSFFVFKGKYRAVLIQYPDILTRLSMFKHS